MPSKSLITVLHIITRLDMGGSAQNTLDTCLRLDPGRYAVTLLHGLSEESQMTEAEIAEVRGGIDRAMARGVRVVPVPALVRRIDLRKDMRAFFTVLKTIRRLQPDIVHTHTSKAGLLGRLAAWLAGVRNIIHTPHGHVFYGHFGPVGSRLFLGLEKLVGRITHRLIALTEPERSDYELLRVAPGSRLLTIHSGVHIDRFNSDCLQNGKRDVLPQLPEDAFVIGYVGWLIPVKGVKTLMEAMAVAARHSAQAHLVFVGQGCLEKEMKTSARQLGIADRIIFTGWRQDVERLMACFDLFVLPSLNEGMGRVLVEAMAAGRPIVASNTGGIPDLVRDGENGILVPPGDSTALADGILRLIRHPRQAHRMGRTGQRLSRDYSVEAMVQKIEKLYDELWRRQTGRNGLPVC